MRRDTADVQYFFLFLLILAMNFIELKQFPFHFDFCVFFFFFLLIHSFSSHRQHSKACRCRFFVCPFLQHILWSAFICKSRARKQFIFISTLHFIFFFVSIRNERKKNRILLRPFLLLLLLLLMLLLFHSFVFIDVASASAQL